MENMKSKCSQMMKLAGSTMEFTMIKIDVFTSFVNINHAQMSTAASIDLTQGHKK